MAKKKTMNNATEEVIEEVKEEVVETEFFAAPEPEMIPEVPEIKEEPVAEELPVEIVEKPVETQKEKKAQNKELKKEKKRYVVYLKLDSHTIMVKKENGHNKIITGSFENIKAGDEVYY